MLFQILDYTFTREAYYSQKLHAIDTIPSILVYANAMCNGKSA